MRFWVLALAAVLAACGSGNDPPPPAQPLVDTTPPVITLTGENPQVIAVGDAYVELGATATDNRDGDLSTSIVIDASAVDSSTPGEYAVTYDVSDASGNAASTIIRTVIYEDRTPPLITLQGDNPQVIILGNPYVESGATATDNVDGDLTDGIVINTAALELGAPGDYSVTYDVSDAAGNAAETVTRTVTVRPPSDTTPPTITLMGENPQVIAVGGAYVELGATATDNRDGDLSTSIVIDASAVNSAVPGEYVVTYNVSDSSGNAAATVIRTVICQDLNPPVITLLGDNPQFIVLGNPYLELGATAVDNIDGDLTSAIAINTTNIDVGAVGNYEVTYDVSDAAGNSAETAIRIVAVHNIASIDLVANTFLMIANGTSYPELKISFIDNDGAVVDESEVTFELRVNGVPQSSSRFTTLLAGDYQLKVFAYGVESNVVDVRAREQKSYPVITVPIIFHIVHFGEPIGIEPNLLSSDVSEVLDRLNAEFSNQMDSTDPNAVDTELRFRAASIAPDGSPLAEPGIRRIDGTAYDDGDKIFYYSEQLLLGGDTYWDPRQYVNVWILETYNNRSWAKGPKLLDSNPLPGVPTVTADYEPSPDDFGAVFLDVQARILWTGHEVGHVLGLPHPFSLGSCGPGDYCADTFDYLFDVPERPACPGNLGLMESTTIMDYVGARNTFTYDQRERIRFVLDNAIWLRELQYSEK